MIIAVASDGMDVSLHFGRCSSYSCYTIENGMVVGFQNMPKFLRSCSEMAKLLKEVHVEVLITGCIGPNAREVFDEAGIEVVSGAHGNVREAVEAYLADELDTDESFCTEEDCCSKAHHLDA